VTNYISLHTKIPTHHWMGTVLADKTTRGQCGWKFSAWCYTSIPYN